MVFSRSFGQGTIERPFGKAAVEKSIAQGTIEYLVIMAIVVVIGLLVVGLSANFINPAKGVSVGIGGLKNMTSGSIIVVDAVSDLEGDGLVILKGLPGENNVITKITVCGVDSDYASTTLVDQGNFALSIPEGCVCSDPGEVSVLSAVIYYTTLSGLNKSVVVETSFDCVGDVNNDVSGVTQPEVGGNVVPVVSLSLPLDGNSTTVARVSFVFVPSDLDGSVSGCSLNVTGLMDANSISVVVDDVNNSIDYELSVGSYDWNVSCTDNNGDTTTSSSRSLTITNISVPVAYFDSCYSALDDPIKICNCEDLDDVRDNLSSNFELQNDINMALIQCEAYQDGAGFNPIGSSSQPFTGNLDGNAHRIIGLYINRAYIDIDEGGLFGKINAGSTVQNLGLQSVGINFECFEPTYGSVGSLAGENYGDLIRVYATGTLTGLCYSHGGLVGYNYGTIQSSYAQVDVTNGNYAGGLIGGGSGIVYNSYATGNVSGLESAGAFIGAFYTNGLIKNSYATGTVSSDTGHPMGGFTGYYDSSEIRNSYWFNSESSCGSLSGDSVESSIECYKASAASDFYNINHNVYDTNTPWWTFGTYPDANWSDANNGLGYPALSWE